MRTFRDPRQARLIDVFEGVISPTGWRLIADGWQGVFRQVVLQQLPAGRLGDDLDETRGRPSAELYSMCGLLLLRDFHNWTVPQTFEAVLFRSDVQYALNLEPGFEVSQRTLERYLARMQDDDGLADELMQTVTDELARLLELSVVRLRLDSTHVLSDMASFGRTRMMGVTVKRFLNLVRRHHLADYAALPDELRTRYEGTVGKLFGDAKTPEARQQNRQQAAEDLRFVRDLFAPHESISQWDSYRQLVTVFDQQCELVEHWVEDALEQRVEVRQHTGGDVIQNPSDEGATYSGHKGAGYQVQLAETCDPANPVQLILVALPQTAVESDAHAVAPVLEELAARGHVEHVESILADTGYGSDENVQRADDDDVQFLSPVPGGAACEPESLGPEHFVLNDATHTVAACPAGHAPTSSLYHIELAQVTVQMPLALCVGCPLLARCPIRLQQKSAILRFTLSEFRSRTRRQAEQTPEYRAAYAPRAGIESTNSGLKRRTGLGQLRVRGSPAVRTSLLLKITGWNILRASGTAKLRVQILKQMLATAGPALKAVLERLAALWNPLLSVVERVLAARGPLLRIPTRPIAFLTSPRTDRARNPNRRLTPTYHPAA